MINSFSENNHLVLIDGYNFLFRAYHSLPPLTNSTGLVIGAVYGYSNMLLKLRKSLKVSHLAVIFDHGDKTFRNEIYDQYKANRPPAPEDLIPQFPLVRDVTKVMNIKAIEKKGYEADDLIATISTFAKNIGLNVTIISSDKDLTQLVDDKVKMYDPMKQKIIDKEVIYQKYGVYPDKMLDLLSLSGDSADNIPGVPGIGPKTAAELLNNFGSLENIFNNVTNITQPKRQQTLIDNKDKALLSKSLVTLKHDVKMDYLLDDLILQEIPIDDLSLFFEKYEFNSLLNKINPDKKIPTSESNDNIKITTKYHITNISNFKQLCSLTDSIKESAIIAIEILADKFYLFTEKQILQADIIIPEHSLLSDQSTGVSMVDIVNYIVPLLKDDTIIKIFTDFKRCYREFMASRTMLDCNNQQTETYNLNHFVNIVDMGVLQYLLPQKSKFKIADYSKITDEKELILAVSDFFINYYNNIKEIVSIKQFSLLYDIDLPLNLLLLEMEDNGFKLDQRKLLKLTEIFKQETQKLEKQIYQLSGEEFNIASPKQLAEILFDKLSIESKKKNKKTNTLSTSSEVLEELSTQGYQIADYILSWRHFTKLQNTYTAVLPKLINKVSNRVHSHFSNTGTSTGRLSSNNPNLQNIPIRSKEGDLIREAFICAENNVLISADYSQIELRLLAHYAKVKKLQKAFHDKHDIHAITASEVFNVPLEKIDDDLRRKAKTINFGIIYGISGFGLAKRLGISRKEASDYINLYFDRYKEIKSYMSDIIAYCKTHGYVETVMKRRLFFPALSTANSATKGFMERAVINAPLQGSAADIIKKAMLDINKVIIGKKLPMKLLLQIHDELIYEVPEELAVAASEIIKNNMGQVIKLDIPLDVSVNYGKNWQEIH